MKREPRSAQFKSQVEEQSRIPVAASQNDAPALLFGWFNPENFHMSHSFSLSYATGGGQALSLGTYTNSMMYQFAGNLNARADVSFSFSPYSTYSTFRKNDLSSVYLSRAEVNYKPWQNFLVQFQYRQIPYGYYSSFYNPWYREDGF